MALHRDYPSGGPNHGDSLMSTTTVVKPTTFSWSYSALKNFETCPRRHYAYEVAREVKEPESEALKHGHAVHAAFQARVAKGKKLPLGMGMHEKMLAKLATAPGEIHAERKLALASTLEPAGWGNAWFRIVLDYTNIRDDGTATVIDYKTGRVTEDMTQLQLAAATLFAHDPEITRVKAALLFVAHEQVERAEFLRDNVTEIWSEVLPRVRKVEEARRTQNYPPKPGGLCKRWCGVRACPFNGK